MEQVNIDNLFEVLFPGRRLKMDPAIFHEKQRRFEDACAGRHMRSLERSEAQDRFRDAQEDLREEIRIELKKIIEQIAEAAKKGIRLPEADEIISMVGNIEDELQGI